MIHVKNQPTEKQSRSKQNWSGSNGEEENNNVLLHKVQKIFIKPKILLQSNFPILSSFVTQEVKS